MGGGKGTGSGGKQVDSKLMNDADALTSIAQTQEQRATQLYNATEPGLETAESFYNSLASGDPGAIMRAIAPAAQQVSQATAGAKKNILENAPSGGEKNLALEMADVNKGAQIGGTASQAFLNAPTALAGLAQQGVGEATAEAGTGISARSAGASSLDALGGLQINQQQLKDQEKGASLGSIGGLIQTGAGMIGGAMGGGGWEGALAALAA